MNTISDDSPMELQFCRDLYRDFSASLFEGQEQPDSGDLRKWYAGLLADLAGFVEAAAATDERPFVPKIEPTGEKGYHPSSLASRYFKLVPMFLKIVAMLSDRYSYSEHIELFIETCTTLGFNDPSVIREDNWHPSRFALANGMNGAEVFNALHAMIRRDWSDKGYKTKFQKRRQESVERTKEYQGFVDAWFDKLATLIVFRVDLYYKKEHWEKISLDDLCADFDHLYNNFRCNKIFRGLRGYIAKIEYGLGKGFHMHVIFLFDTEHKNGIRHVHHAKLIGKYWVKAITKGRGEYWNCNAKAKEFDAKGILGIGPIHVSDKAKRDNLSFRVVDYLCKMDQFIRPKGRESKHLIRHSKWPTPEPKKLGAPRKAPSNLPVITNIADTTELEEAVDALGY